MSRLSALLLLTLLPLALSANSAGSAAPAKPPINPAQAPVLSSALAITADPLDDPHVILSRPMRHGVQEFSVRGSSDFKLTVTNLDPAQTPRQIYIGMADGKLYTLDPTQAELVFNCKYLFTYYSLALIEYSDGTVKACAFNIDPAWKRDQASLIPHVHLPMKRPRSSNRLVNTLLKKWWTVLVQPLERQRLRDEQTAPVTIIK